MKKYSKVPATSSNFGYLGVLVLLSFYTAAFFSLAVEFQQTFYDWDLDTEMYFGNEFLAGRPIWISEFHDKLPALQLLFSLPAFFGDVNIWRGFGVLLIILSTFVGYFFASSLLPKLEVSQARFIFIFAGALNMLIVEFTAGGISHINSSAASLAAIATMLLVSTSSHREVTKSNMFLQILAGLAGALSVSIRPYFVIPLFAVFTIILVKSLCSKSSSSARYKTIWLSFLPITLFVSFGILLNVGPYIFMGKFDSFVEGLKFLAQPLVPLRSIDVYLQSLPREPLSFSISSLYQWLIATWSTILLAVSAGLLLVSFIGKTKQLLSNVLIPVSVILLAFSAFSQHWWPHYSNMFAWYGAILTAYAFVHFIPVVPALPQRKSSTLRPLASLTATVISFVVAWGLITLSNARPHGTEYEHPRQQQLIVVSGFLDSEFNVRPSFLSPEDMYVHWRLKESRHGFPHAGNTVQITQGWWQYIKKPGTFSTPSNIAEYCMALNSSGIKVIFLDPGSKLNSCFESDVRQDRVSWQLGTEDVPNIVQAYVLK